MSLQGIVLRPKSLWDVLLHQKLMGDRIVYPTSVLVDIDPVQSGSGTPSPSNVRPISGWDEVEVTVSPTLDAQDGTAYTTDLGRTVYSGTVDIVSGVLTVDRAMVTLNSSDIVAVGTSTSDIHYAKMSPINNAKNNGNIVADKYINSATPSVNNAIRLIRQDVYIYDNRFTDLSTARAVMGDVQAIYELATPQTYQLTPQEVEMLRSDHVWANSGNVVVIF